MSEPVYEQRDQWTVNACQTWTAFLGENCRKEENCGRSDFFLFWHDSLLFSSQVQSFFLPFFIDFLFSAVASVWPVMLSFFSTPLFFHMILQQKPKTLEGWIHITLIDSRRKTPFIFDAVFLILDEWIEDKEFFQSKLFSCLSSPQSWKAKTKV